MQRFLKIVGALALIALLFGAGYVLGVRSVMQRVCKPAAAAEGPQQKSIPYPGTICADCYANYPDWWCFVGGCPWP